MSYKPFLASISFIFFNKKAPDFKKGAFGYSLWLF